MADHNDWGNLELLTPRDEVKFVVSHRSDFTWALEVIDRHGLAGRLPVLISPHDPATLYAGGNRLFRSTDRGHSWKPISPDLTLGIDRDTMALLGVKGKDIAIAKNDGVNEYGTLFTIAESRKKAGLVPQ